MTEIPADSDKSRDDGGFMTESDADLSRLTERHPALFSEILIATATKTSRRPFFGEGRSRTP